MRAFPLLPLLAALLLPFAASAQDLEGTIAAALAHSPVLEATKAEEAAARAQLDRAKAEANPLLRVEGSVGTGRIDNGGFFGLTADDVTPLALQATGEVPLFAGGRIAAAVDQARGGSEIAQLRSEQARLQTIVDAVSAHAGVLAARKLVARYERLVGALAETERHAELRFQVGDVPSTDVAQARARTAEGVAGLAEAQGRLASAEARYRRLTGKSAAELAPLPAPPPTPATLDEAVDGALAANPALQQAEKAISVARAGVRAAKAEALPTIGAFAEAAHVRDQFFPGYRADSYAVGLRGRWTIFAGGRVASQTRKAEAELAASDARARDAREQVEAMAIDAWQGYQTARRMVEASALRSAAAEEALRSTRLEAQVGAKPTLAVLDAEREAVAAEAARIEAEAMRLVGAYRLNALTGMLAP